MATATSGSEIPPTSSKTENTPAEWIQWQDSDEKKLSKEQQFVIEKWWVPLSRSAQNEQFFHIFKPEWFGRDGVLDIKHPRYIPLQTLLVGSYEKILVHAGPKALEKATPAWQFRADKGARVIFNIPTKKGSGQVYTARAPKGGYIDREVDAAIQRGTSNKGEILEKALAEALKGGKKPKKDVKTPISRRAARHARRQSPYRKQSPDHKPRFNMPLKKELRRHASTDEKSLRYTLSDMHLTPPHPHNLTDDGERCDDWEILNESDENEIWGSEGSDLEDLYKEARVKAF
ncbi:hypothetical protein K432DRAFT_391434 [Lepidopterella palustris CBS 459.81]|uniref:Uncharacterized protein n=1 Tax=Lepidopterella palustris CBS 459.81 TaxID=1314670 RepID=A0A8E2EEC2_9PEZI|nr:hypothetical protein K432DRAFT_391434 [Lepidopterella palustris CBS 459.81]